MRIFALALLALVLVGCATAPPTAQQCGPEPTPDQVDAAVQTFMAGENWKDESSVQIRNVSLRNCQAIVNGILNPNGRMTGWVVLLEVNAKNSYGGYTGYQQRTLVITADHRVRWDL